MSSVRYAPACVLQKSARRPEGLKYSTSETSYHRIGYVHQGGPCVKGPAGAGAIDIAG